MVVINFSLKGRTKFVFDSLSRANPDARIIQVGRYQFIEIDSTREPSDLDSEIGLDDLVFLDDLDEDEDVQGFELFEKRYLVISDNELFVANDKNYLEKILARKESKLESESDFIRIKITWRI